MSLNNFVKTIQNIMRVDNGINGDAQRIEQMTWILFLKIYGTKEANWQFVDESYTSIIPEEMQWENWATDNKDGNALTGNALLDFVNNDLLPTLKNLVVDSNTTVKQSIVKDMFEDANNYMKDGVALRKVINVIDEIDFDEFEDKHAFGDIYESILKSLQSAGNAGEFYTPRAVTDFMVQVLQPKLGERIADFACGTGGFLTSALKALEPQVQNIEDRETFNNSLYGIEKKPLPHMLCVTNMLLHDIDKPKILHGNGLEDNVREYKPKDKFDLILLNPPYGGSENNTIKANFPADLQSSETADLFMAVVMYRLKDTLSGGGRAGVIIPDGFLFGNDGAKTALKKKLIEEYNLHTIIRLPASVFAPYTSITTNVLFFDNHKKTEDVWFYRVDMPATHKHFSKTKPMKLEHFADCVAWWNNRTVIQDDETETFKAQKYTAQHIIDTDFNLDLCGYPSIEEEVLTPEQTMQNFVNKRTALNKSIDETLATITAMLKEGSAK